MSGVTRLGRKVIGRKIIKVIGRKVSLD